MRKWIWSATGLMVFSCAAMYLAAQHAAEHPNSFAASFFRGASTIGMRCNPLLAIGQATLPEPPRPVDKPVCQPICLLPDPMEMAQEQPAIALPGIGEAPEVSEPIVVESEPPPPPAAEEPAYPQPGYPAGSPQPSYPPPASEEPISEQPTEPIGSGDDEEILPQPAEEPSSYYAPDDQGPSMPYVSDDADEFEDVNADDEAPTCESCAAQTNGCCCSCMLRLVKVMCGNEGCPDCCAKTLGEIVAEYLNQLAGQEEATDEQAPLPENSADQAEDAPSADDVVTPPDAGDTQSSAETPMNPDEPQEPGAAPNHHPAREDPHYHHHYPSCPYTGRCPYPYHYNTPRVDTVEKPRSDEPQPTPEPAQPVKTTKPVKKKKFFFLLIGEAVIDCQPGVDTMECRPTDIHGKVESPF